MIGPISRISLSSANPKRRFSDSKDFINWPPTPRRDNGRSMKAGPNRSDSSFSRFLSMEVEPHLPPIRA